MSQSYQHLPLSASPTGLPINVDRNGSGLYDGRRSAVIHQHPGGVQTFDKMFLWAVASSAHRIVLSPAPDLLARFANAVTIPATSAELLVINGAHISNGLTLTAADIDITEVKGAKLADNTVTDPVIQVFGYIHRITLG